VELYKHQLILPRNPNVSIFLTAVIHHNPNQVYIASDPFEESLLPIFVDIKSSKLASIMYAPNPLVHLWNCS